MRVGRVLAGVALGTGVAAVAAVMAATPLLERGLASALRHAGYPRAVVSVEHLGLRDLRLTVMFDPATQQRLGTVALEWSPAGLLRGELDRIAVSRPRIEVAVDGEGRVSLAGASATNVDERDEGWSLPALPAREILVSEGELLLSTPQERIELPVQATFARPRDGDGLDGQLNVGAPDAPTGARFVISVVADRLKGEGNLRIGDLAPVFRFLDPAGGTGKAAFSVAIDVPWPLDRADGEPLVVTAEGSAADVVFSDMRLSLPQASLTATGAPGNGRAALQVRLKGSGGLAALGEVEEAALSFDGTVQWTNGVVLATPTGCANLSVGGVKGAAVTLSRPASLCIAALPDHALLMHDRGGLHLAARSEPTRLDLSLGEARTTLRAELPAIDALGVLAGGTVVEARVSAAGVAVSLPDDRIAVRDARLTADYRPDREKPLTAALTARVEHGGEPSAWVPLPITAGIDGDPAGELVLSGTAAVAGRNVGFDGRHDMAAGRGHLRMSRTELSFGEGKDTTLDAVSPLLASRVRHLSGTVGLKGRITWDREHGFGGGGADLLLRDIGFVAGPVTVSGMNAVLTANRLLPLVLPSGQRIAVGLLDVGVPLTDGLIRFDLDAERLNVTEATWNWAGGQLRAEPMALSLHDFSGRTALTAERLDLSQVFAFVAVDGLVGEGALAGRLPLRIGQGTVAVEQGRLAATGPGHLRYAPEMPPSFLAGNTGSGGDLLRRALTDFRYETLELGIDGRAGGEMKVTLVIRGANPGFYDGYPVALNLNVSGALDTILRRGVSAYRIPDAVRDRMLEFENRGD